MYYDNATFCWLLRTKYAKNDKNEKLWTRCAASGFSKITNLTRYSESAWKIASEIESGACIRNKSSKNGHPNIHIGGRVIRLFDQIVIYEIPKTVRFIINRSAEITRNLILEKGKFQIVYWIFRFAASIEHNKSPILTIFHNILLILLLLKKLQTEIFGLFYWLPFFHYTKIGISTPNILHQILRLNLI